MNGPAKKPKRFGAASGDEPPYARYAFLNPYNVTLLLGAATAALATGHWWILLCAFAAEAIWMLFAPDSKLLQKIWFDKIWNQSREDAVEDRQDAKLKQLGPVDQQRVAALRQQKQRILELAQENPSLTVDLMGEELAKLDGLVEDFIDLGVVCSRNERHLGSFDFQAMERSWLAYKAQVERAPEGEAKRVAQKNLDVLEQRRSRWDEMRNALQTSRGQMDLMENTFKLLGDEIITMSAPGALGARLDDLRIGVEAIRETNTENQALYEEEPAEQAAARKR